MHLPKVKTGCIIHLQKEVVKNLKNRGLVIRIAISGIVGALYIVLVAVFGFMSFGPIQMRVAEVLCVLPFFVPSSAIGLSIGCLLANMLFSTLGVWDWVLGSGASLIAALMAAYMSGRPKLRIVSTFPAVILNAFVVPAVLLLYNVILGDAYLVTVLTVGAGQLLACVGLGGGLSWLLAHNDGFMQLCESLRVRKDAVVKK